MNTNVLKMIEKLGYTIDYKNFRIYDKNNKELIKKKIVDDVNDGIIFVGDNEDLIHFDENGHTEVRVDNKTTIIVHNLYSEHGFNSISVYFGKSSIYPELTVAYDVFKKSKFDENNCIFVSINENDIYKEDGNNFTKTLNIVENRDGADISLFDKVIDHINIDECTKEKYLDIIIKFISSIENENIRNDAQRSFEMIMPALIPSIDDFINSRKLGKTK